jgi:hypothetical protein
VSKKGGRREGLQEGRKKGSYFLKNKVRTVRGKKEKVRS